MSQRREYFEFKLPYLHEMREEYRPPYMFSDDMRESVDKVFLKHNHKWHKEYLAQREKGYIWDNNEMCQVLYSIVMYAKNNLNSIGGEMDNALDQITVSMWKRFLANNNSKYGRDNNFDKYYTTDLKINMRKGVSKLVDEMLTVIDTHDYIYHHDDMVKVRKGVGLRDRRLEMGEDQILYYEKLCEEEIVGGEVAVDNWVSG